MSVLPVKHAQAVTTRMPAPVRSAVIVLGLWLLFGLVQASFLWWFLPLSGDRAYRWTTMALWCLPEALLRALATPVIVALSRRWPFIPGRRRVALPIHAVAALAIHFAIAWALMFARVAPQQMPVAARLLSGLVFDLLLYAIVVVAWHALEFQRLEQRRREEALELRSALAESRLQVLTMQLQPHFLFNTLHAISELVYRDPALADRAISHVAELLRMALASSGQVEGTLGEELTFLTAYCELERLRAAGPLTLAIDVPADERRLALPVLILQPLVENAFRHGLRAGGGTTVAVRARRENERLHLEVEDDGRGLPVGPLREGLGLRNTRARLESLYDGGHRLAIGPGSGGGVLVTIDIPARRPAGEAPAGVLAHEAT
jgi:two-component system LytT family sensor kinase